MSSGILVCPLVVTVDWDQYRDKNVAHLAYGRPAGLSDGDEDSLPDPDECRYDDPTFEGMMEVHRGNGYYEVYATYKDGTTELVDHYIYHWTTTDMRNYIYILNKQDASL